MNRRTLQTQRKPQTKNSVKRSINKKIVQKADPSCEDPGCGCGN